ncbi:MULTISPECIES: ABC transporter permease [unclassified Streptomyces]|uniref:ABC transporter permease n=1 Tax=Streptomyces sp. R35 TaxID=3238630 RepID=A0AB39SCM4_9ACTN|nr:MULTISPECIES: ABC transporter permease [unclassified Streptomyces]WSP73944.1 ABC transporter permease [Streptomyces sp. NBC_01236]WTI36496.1 ABC transporter permease [Streptomyces sp. NBC_00775]WUB29828.1 ABC transporter permease [Streptomyces sp. NBC_00589]
MTPPTPSAAAPLEVTDETEKTSAPSSTPKGSESRSPGRLAWKRFKRDRTGVISAYIVIFFFAIAICAPLISKLYGKDPYTTYASQRPELLDAFSYPSGPNGGMSSEFWFGIEPQLGRDVFTYLLYGIRTSLGLAVAATLLTTVVGVIIGITAGYLGGKTDYFVGRIIDIVLSFPSTLFFIAFMPVVYGLFVAPDDNIPTSLRAVSLILVLSAFGWASIARLLRGQVLGLREREYIEAAKVTGASPRRIVFKELLPNLWTPIIIQSTLMLPAYVTAEAGLSFLGVGIIDPTPDWGVMIQRGAQFYTEDLTFMLFPGLSMVIFVLAFNLLGDSVRDALDPKSKR